jgi:phospholipase D3/4
VLYHFRIILVESIPLGVTYDEDNVTFGVPLEQAWNDLISLATENVEVASFYWSLTGGDVNVNSSSALPVSEVSLMTVITTILAYVEYF